MLLLVLLSISYRPRVFPFYFSFYPFFSISSCSENWTGKRQKILQFRDDDKVVSSLVDFDEVDNSRM